ncbi:hypothetical protein SASPL_145370 [Salvia splendens]|uniref:UBC core domain-containing protein n=1 Tax=Salvia splendens TaxID=180675 RepID=A0A8X8WHE7_SALSN|nr:hypothetical protein SASPL_145370 [Salvia splendens]
MGSDGMNFDSVEVAKDHHYINYTSQKTNNAKIMREWRILKGHLPDSIHVQVYETRIDLLRAVIIGPGGTPYHDGLFFFDIFLPTFHHNGTKQEKWTNTSTVLQLLVSIQGLVLNSRPYFNEPVFAPLKNTKNSMWRAAPLIQAIDRYHQGRVVVGELGMTSPSSLASTVSANFKIDLQRIRGQLEQALASHSIPVPAKPIAAATTAKSEKKDEHRKTGLLALDFPVVVPQHHHLATFFPPALHSGWGLSPSAAQMLATPPSRFKLLFPLGKIVRLHFEEEQSNILILSSLQRRLLVSFHCCISDSSSLSILDCVVARINTANKLLSWTPYQHDQLVAGNRNQANWILFLFLMEQKFDQIFGADSWLF